MVDETPMVDDIAMSPTIEDRPSTIEVPALIEAAIDTVSGSIDALFSGTPSSTDDTVVMEMPVDERTTNTAGGLQGGLIATMADVTAGQLAARSTPFGHGIATTDLFIRYLRPIKIGPARAVARILRTGKRSVVVQVDIYRGNDGEMSATATVNFAAMG